MKKMISLVLVAALLLSLFTVTAFASEPTSGPAQDVFIYGGARVGVTDAKTENSIYVMNFDYDKLQELCSDELYNSYKKELEVLMFKNDQNIMNSFHLKEISIENVIEQKDYLEISIYLDITFKDYVIDRSTKKVIQGNKWNKIRSRASGNSAFRRC